MSVIKLVHLIWYSETKMICRKSWSSFDWENDSKNIINFDSSFKNLGKGYIHFWTIIKLVPKFEGIISNLDWTLIWIQKWRKRRSEWKSSYACNGLVVFIPFTRLNRMQRFVTRRLVTASADGWTFGWPRKESTIGAKSFLKAPHSNSEIPHVSMYCWVDIFWVNFKTILYSVKLQKDKNSNANS